MFVGLGNSGGWLVRAAGWRCLRSPWREVRMLEAFVSLAGHWVRAIGWSKMASMKMTMRKIIVASM